MANHDDLARIALGMEGAVSEADGLTYSVSVGARLKGFVWPWRERIHPRKPKVPNPDVLVVRTNGLSDKEARIANQPEIYFTEAHYDGYSAVLVRLEVIQVEELHKVVAESYQLTKELRGVWRRSKP